LKTNKAKVKSKEGDLEFPLDKIYQWCLVENKNNDDLCEIDTLNDASLLHNLRVRTEEDDIYSYCGPTLIAMNPFRMVPKLFNPTVKGNFVKYSISTDNQ